MSKIIELKQLESMKEASMKGNAEEQLVKLQEHGVFYVSTHSDVETIAAVERHAHQLNLNEFENMARESYATGNLTTVKHFVPRVNHLPFEHFTASEIGEKLNTQNSDEFSYVTGIINAIIKDMFLSLNKVIEMNIDEKKSIMNKFHETLLNRLDTASYNKLDDLKMKTISNLVNQVAYDLTQNDVYDNNKVAINSIVDNYFNERRNLSNKLKEKIKEHIPTNTGAMTHIYLLPSYILKTTNDRLRYVIKYLLELVMSSYYEFKLLSNEDTQLDLTNSYKIAFIGPREDMSLMPVAGFKHIDFEVLPKDMVIHYLNLYEERVLLAIGYEQLTQKVKNSFYETFKHLSALEFMTLINAMAMSELNITEEFIEINKNYRVDKTNGLQSIISNVQLDDVAGIDNVRDYAGNVLKSLENPSKLSKYNLSAIKGLLLAGLPGTAKSTIAKALANYWGLHLYQLEVGSLMSHLVGKSENNVKNYFNALTKEGKCVLWIDEFEKAFAGASSEVTDSGTSNRVYQIFLTFLQENENVILVATANDLTKLPPEFMRSGRFDKKFFIDVPSKTDRSAIFEVIMKRHNIYELATEENLKMFKEVSEHYTGADIQKVVDLAIRNNIDSTITAEHIIKECKSHKPDAQSFKEQYKVLRKKAGDFEPASKNTNESKHLGFEDYLTPVNTLVSLEQVGGMDIIKKELADYKVILEQPDKAKKYGVKVVKNFIFSGIPGTGKSLLIKATANFLGKRLYRLDLGSLFSKFVGESFANVKFALDAAVSLAKEEVIILWMDELEKLFNNMNSSSTESHILQYFLTWLEEQRSVLVMATANDLSKIPVELIRSGRFDFKFFIDLPSNEERMAIVESVLSRINSTSEYTHTIENIEEIANKMKYYSGSDINNVIEKAINQSFVEYKDGLKQEVLLDVIKSYQPDSKTHSDKYQTIREDYGAMFQPASSKSKFYERLDMGKYLRKVDTTNFSFETIGGMDNIKKHIKKEKAIFQQPEAAKEFGLQVPKGIMLAGYSGTGKTAMAKAITTDMDVEMYSLTMSDIINKWVGESEKNFKKVLDSIKRISQEKKVVFFIDEFDKAFGSSQSEHRNNILQEFLAFLQDEHENIFIIVTANDTTKIPVELMRAGRFDKKFFVGLPTLEERESILHAVIKKINKGFEIKPQQVKIVAQKMEGYTGADIENVVNEVLKVKFFNGDLSKTLEKKHFTEVISNYTPDEKMLKYQIDENTIKQFTPASSTSVQAIKRVAIGFNQN